MGRPTSGFSLRRTDLTRFDTKADSVLAVAYFARRSLSSDRPEEEIGDAKPVGP